MAPEGSRRVEVAGLGDKRQITATFAGTLSGEFLPMQLLYQPLSCQLTFPRAFHIHHTANHWANEDTVKLFFEKVIVPCVAHIRQEKQIPDQKALLIMDNFAAHYTGDVMQALVGNGVLMHCLFAIQHHGLSPTLDLSISKPAKDFLRVKFRHWYTEQIFLGLQGAPEGQVVSLGMRVGVMRELGAQWLVAFYNYVCSRPELIVNGLKETGIADAVENGEVNLSPQDRSLSHPWYMDETNPFLDIDSD